MVALLYWIAKLELETIKFEIADFLSSPISSQWSFHPFLVSVSVLVSVLDYWRLALLRTRTDRCKGVSIKVKLMGKNSAKLMQLLSIFAGSGHISLKIVPSYCKDYTVYSFMSVIQVIYFSNPIWRIKLSIDLSLEKYLI